ncbi:MAG: hypothetical protein ACREUY_05770 [Burkholderiales bacterium]
MKTATMTVTEPKTAKTPKAPKAPTAAELGVANIIQPAGNTPVAISDANLTARANPALAPKPSTPAVPSATTGSGTAEKVAPSDQATPVVPSKQAQFDQAVALHLAGKKPAEIASEMGLTYGQVKVLLWFNYWMDGTAPGCAGYTTMKRADAQRRYEAQVAANKVGKAARVATPAVPATEVPAAK